MPTKKSFLKPVFRLLFLKIALGCTANRAFPIIRQIFKSSPWFYAAVRVAFFRVIHITTY
jgi:hypothetical protein